MQSSEAGRTESMLPDTEQSGLGVQPPFGHQWANVQNLNLIALDMSTTQGREEKRDEMKEEGGPRK